MELDKKVRKELMLEIVIFCLSIGSVLLFYRRNLLVTVFVALAWLIGVNFWHSKEDLYTFLMGAIVGPLSEIVCIHFGVWRYTNPSFLGIPVWLPFVWGLAAMVIKRSADTWKLWREEEGG